jgi:ABC-type Fe3+ transport system permease subunit
MATFGECKQFQTVVNLERGKFGLISSIPRSGILIGAMFSFLTSIQEASATIFLTLGGWEMMPFGIFTFYIAGSQSQAAALGVILIAMCAASLYVVNRIAGTRVGGLFG